MTEVLLIDDDRDIVRGLELRLKAKGFFVHVAYGGKDGLALAIEHRPDAIVLDIRMPDVTGLEVLEQLKSDARVSEIPVIMCSASLFDERATLDRGAHIFVQKPFDGAKLIKALQAVLDQQPIP